MVLLRCPYSPCGLDGSCPAGLGGYRRSQMARFSKRSDQDPSGFLERPANIRGRDQQRGFWPTFAANREGPEPRYFANRPHTGTTTQRLCKRVMDPLFTGRGGRVGTRYR